MHLTKVSLNGRRANLHVLYQQAHATTELSETIAIRMDIGKHT